MGINALYLWPITVWTYIKYGRPELPSKDIENGAEEDEEDPLLPSGRWMDQNEDNTSGERRSGCIVTCHCGAGCVLGDIVGEWLVYWSGASISGSMLYAAFVVDFALALAFGIVFQYFSIAPMAGD